MPRFNSTSIHTTRREIEEYAKRWNAIDDTLTDKVIASAKETLVSELEQGNGYWADLDKNSILFPTLVDNNVYFVEVTFNYRTKMTDRDWERDMQDYEDERDYED